MPSTQKKDPEKQDRADLKATIVRQVLHTLGRPGDLRTVEVRRLWEDRYRVNVLAGKDAVSLRITDSYFVMTDSDGNILESSPKISKQY